MSHYTDGQNAAFVFFGIEKTATPLISRPSLWAKAGKSLKGMLPTWQGTKRMFIGEPGKFVNELANRKMLSKGSLIRESFHTPGMFNKALFYGLPALDAVNTLRGNSPDKPGELGSLVGSTALGMAAFRPLGLVGAMAAGTAGGALGKGLVHGGQRLLGKTPPQQQPADPYTNYGVPSGTF